MDMKLDGGETETARLEEPSPEDSAPKPIDHDDGLILWMLSLSPEKRLEVAQGFVDSVRILRSGRRAPISRHP
jgi:hypothetical protein